MTEKLTSLPLIESIQSQIFVIRGKKVMIDQHLAHFYQIKTADLKRAVKRNLDRFPDDFMMVLTKSEMENLRCQIGTLRWGAHTKYLSYAFTELGIAMLSSVLNSSVAIQVNIQIMRIFHNLRMMLLNNKDLKRKIEILERKYKGHDHQIQTIFEIIHQLIEPPEQKNKKEIGFIR